MSGTRPLPSKRSSFSQKSQSNLYKPKFTTHNNHSSTNLNSSSIKKAPLKKSSSSMSINPNSKIKPDKKVDRKKTINNNNNTQNEQTSVNCDEHQIDNNDDTVQQIKLSFPPGITVDQDGKSPVNSTLVKQKYRKMLTSYEVTEIDDYSEIYYIGNSIIKKTTKGSFDNFHTFQYQAKSGDHIAYRYEILSVLHVGPYSTVYKCTDHKSKEKVAIKILINTPEIHQRRQIEVENMKILSSNDAPTDMTPIGQIQTQSKSSDENRKHYVKMIDSFVFRNHICIVMELLGESLEKFMTQNTPKMHKKEQQLNSPISPLMVKLIAYQIMDALADIHRKKIIHRDLQPQNILFTNQQQENLAKPKPKTEKNPNQQSMAHQITSAFTESDNLLSMSKVKIIDFGSSFKQTEILSNHIKNRFYAAPEIVLESSYGTSIDVWAAGCIIVELFIGKPLNSNLK